MICGPCLVLNQTPLVSIKGLLKPESQTLLVLFNLNFPRSALIDIPPNTLDYGLYKLFFKLEVDTGVPELPLYKKAFTYFNLTRSPLIPGFIKGSVSKVT